MRSNKLTRYASSKCWKGYLGLEFYWDRVILTTVFPTTDYSKTPFQRQVFPTTVYPTTRLSNDGLSNDGLFNDRFSNDRFSNDGDYPTTVFPTMGTIWRPYPTTGKLRRKRWFGQLSFNDKHDWSFNIDKTPVDQTGATQ